MELPETEPEVFSLLVAYLHRGEVPLFTREGVCYNPSDYERKQNAWYKQLQNLVNLYIFAENHCLNIAILNRVMDRVQEAHYWSEEIKELDPSLLLHWYYQTSPGSKLRKFFMMFVFWVLKWIYPENGMPVENQRDRQRLETIEKLLLESGDFRKEFMEATVLEGPMVFGLQGRTAFHRRGHNNEDGDARCLEPFCFPCCYFHVHNTENKGIDCYLAEFRTGEDDKNEMVGLRG